MASAALVLVLCPFKRFPDYPVEVPFAKLKLPCPLKVEIHGLNAVLFKKAGILGKGFSPLFS